MTETDFWQLIRETHSADCDDHVRQLVDKLCTLPQNEILHFGWWWAQKSQDAYRWDLWGAAYIIGGGCSDDGFDYFRDWLILQGQKAYEAALEQPDRLAEILDGEEVEYQCNPALYAYERLTGKDDYFDAVEALGLNWPESPELGVGWDFDDAKLMRKKYPRLYKMYMGSV